MPDSHCGRYQKILSRRDLLKKAGGGLGIFALADLIASNAAFADNPQSAIRNPQSTNPQSANPQLADPLAPRPPHYAPKAKSIIWLFMEGAPSGVDLFDPKPELTKRHGQKMAIDVFNGNPGPLMKSPFTFRQYGQCGQWVCDRYPNVAKHVDEFAFIKSLYTEPNDHVPAILQI